MCGICIYFISFFSQIQTCTRWDDLIPPNSTLLTAIMCHGGRLCETKCIPGHLRINELTRPD